MITGACASSVATVSAIISYSEPAGVSSGSSTGRSSRGTCLNSDLILFGSTRSYFAPTLLTETCHEHKVL